jgi:hypothetical protein
MKKILLPLFALLLLCTAAIFNACQKENEPEPGKPISLLPASENAIAESVFADVMSQTSFGAKGAQDTCQSNKSSWNEKSGCATLTIDHIDLTTWPKNLVLNFGTTNCLGTDGRYRRGKININITGWWHDSATVVTVVPHDYYVDNHKVQGTETITNKGRKSNGNLHYSVVVNNALITKPDGTSFTWNTTREHEWSVGELTVNPYDDVYLITGSANGTSSAGEAYTINITETLNVLVGCRWIRSGKIDVNITGLPTITVDYGAGGSCDANAVAYVNGQAYPFVMQ